MIFHDFIKEHFNLEVDGNEWMNEYHSYFGEAHQLLPGIEGMLGFARKQRYKLTILSNDGKFMQRHRLELAGIKNYFDSIVTFEGAHYSKPNPYTFDCFFSRTEISPNEILFSGDGLQSGISNVEKYGLDSTWYSHHHGKDIIGLHPLFGVETYPEFVKIMQNGFQRAY